MTKAEVASLLMLVKAYYPHDRESDIKERAAAWHYVLADYPYDLGKAAVVGYVSNDTKGFPPTVGQIVEQIRMFTRPEARSDELKEWSVIAKAARNSSMDPSSRRLPDRRTSAEREFDKLPEALKDIVHSPEQLAAWGSLDQETLNSVTQSQFLRAYRARRETQQHIDALPSGVAAALMSARDAPLLVSQRMEDADAAGKLHR